MITKGNIQSGFLSKLFYLVFTLFLFVPVSGYIYNIQEYTKSYRVESVFIPFSHKNRTCYRLTSKWFHSHNKTIYDSIFVSYSYALVYYTNKVNSTLIQQEIKCFSIHKIRLFPSNKYHNDTDDHELRIPESIS